MLKYRLLAQDELSDMPSFTRHQQANGSVGGGAATNSRDSWKTIDSARSQATTLPLASAASVAIGSPQPRSPIQARDSGLVSPSYLQLLHADQQRRAGSSCSSMPPGVVSTSAPGVDGGINSGSTLLSRGALSAYEMPVPLERANCECAVREGATPYQNLQAEHTCPLGRRRSAVDGEVVRNDECPDGGGTTDA